MKWIYYYLRLMQRTCFAFIILVLSLRSFSQPYYFDSVLVSHSSDFVKNFYNSNRNNFSPLYNGLMHYPNSPFIEGTPYWIKDWQKGNIVFEGVFYENVIMKYDLVKDKVIVMSAEQGRVSLELLSQRVREFYFLGLKFIYLDKNSFVSLKKGFYQELTAGNMIALCKTEKTIDERIVGTSVERKFNQTKKYFIISNDRLYTINRKKDLSKAFKDHKKEVLGHIKQMNLKFNKNKEQIITEASTFYNKIERKGNE